MCSRFAVGLIVWLMVTQVPAAAVTIEVLDAKGDPVREAQVVVVCKADGNMVTAETDPAGVADVKLDPGRRVSILCAHQDFKGWQQANVELVEKQTIKLKSVRNWASILFTAAEGTIPGLDGQLTVLYDQTGQFRLYSENMLVNGKRQALVPIRVKRKATITDMQKNIAEIAVVGSAGNAILIDFSVRPAVIPKAAHRSAEFVVTDRRNIPVENADVVLVHVRNNTFVAGKTNELGEVVLKDFPNEPVVVYCGHKSFRAFRDVLEAPHGSHKIELVQENGIGSAVFPGRTGYISGLQGRLNPILDNLGRTYLYADNIALDGGKQQPVYFSLGRPIDATDAEGTHCQLQIVDIKGDTSLIEYQFR